MEEKKGGKIIDELSQDSKRYSVLDVLEDAVKDKSCLSRVLILGKADDRGDVERDTEEKIRDLWDSSEENRTLKELFNIDTHQVAGMLYTVGSFYLHFLEGTSDGLFALLQKLPTDCVVLYFTECHGLKTMRGWRAFHAGGKGGNALPEDLTAPERIFGMYKRLLELHAVEDEPTPGYYQEVMGDLPNTNDLTKLADPALNPSCFPLEEFLEYFLGPMSDILHSELLWPIPPALRYTES